MGFELTFWVIASESGRATYIATKNHGRTPPYQEIVNGNFSKQVIYFRSIEDMSKFLKEAFTTFSKSFIVKEIVCDP